MNVTQEFSLPDSAGQVHLRILATSDLHVQVLPYDYYADRPVDTHGLARTASLIAAARAEAANCLLLDNGDFLQGNPMGDLYSRPGQLAPGQVHPILAAMNLLGYDAGTLGNHEFNYGLDFLQGVLKGAGYPLVSANIALGENDAPTLLPPYVLLDRQVADGAGASHNLRIGVIGFAPPQIVQWDRALLGNQLTTSDIVESAVRWVPQMQAAGCDVIVALSHSGIGGCHAVAGMENASTALAALPGIDAVVAGHSHLVFPGPGFAGLPGVDPVAGRLCGKPAVMPGFWGSHLGVIDLALQRAGGRWQVQAGRATTRAIWQRGADGLPHAQSDTDAAVASAMAGYHAETLAYARSPVGRASAPLNSFFALVTPSPAVAVVAEAQARHAAAWLADMPEAGLPLLSAVAPFKTGGRGGPENYTDVPAGDMALRHAADLYIYPNTVAVLRLTGAEVAEWLERAAGIFHRITPGLPDQPLIDPDFPSYNFDLIHGLSFTIDLAQPARYHHDGRLADPAAQRITGLAFGDGPVDPCASFIVASNSYRAAGSGGFAARPALLTGTTSIRDTLLAHIAATNPLPPPAPPFWRFAPMPGTSVTFDTAPAARAMLGDVPHLALTALGDTADGFVRFRLAL
ncbi:bifunctional 2',3'-cyclic-nucleotide 2'-phosphodiesterase/3'-nucleotidase [Fertoebacter nigrum]|uniref:Bifunctional 2',3'-cyclic-nucleotide 2'-phosphodiesterase/3'-nucleotidase n=1 Tax=Fertoeibacter niger TaxID=2656921 RepID=A0A8X8KPB8_9RHOB|nr:bifunctional 2',3'-cyclic-nucleotide 2'-phosphodiesterase/3'-nucleotidase [Fertoeibacter niger]